MLPRVLTKHQARSPCSITPLTVLKIGFRFHDTVVSRVSCACRLLSVLAGFLSYLSMLGLSPSVFPRPEFVSEVSKLSDGWQSAARGVQQRKCDIDRQVAQWQFFTTSVEDLLRFLADTGHLLSAMKEQDHHSLYQTRRLIHELKVIYVSVGVSE